MAMLMNVNTMRLAMIINNPYNNATLPYEILICKRKFQKQPLTASIHIGEPTFFVEMDLI
jgi:hypothetical protein